MAENLNYETGKSYCYNDSAEYCTKYGRLYEWNAAKLACPADWHLPTNAEFEVLFSTVGGQFTAGIKLKSTSGWGRDGNGSDDFSFSALPAGNVGVDGNFYNDKKAYFWSSTEHYSDVAYFIRLDYGNDSADLVDDLKILGYSVRCVKDDPNESVKVVQDSVSYQKPCKTDEEDSCEYGSLKDGRDGQTYKTVKIGKQVWMAENLNYETKESYCYNDSAEYCAKYGRLYKWNAALNVCPSGWHLPTRNEGVTLFNSVGGLDTAAKMLKSVDGWTENGSGTDSFGFTALAVGDRDEFNAYENEGRFTGFWTSTEVNENYAAHIHLFCLSDDAAMSSSFNKEYGYAVRCVKD